MRPLLLSLISFCLGVSAQLPATPHHVVLPDWPALPKDYRLGLCAGIGVDSHNRVFVFHRCGRQWTNPFPADPIAQATVSVIDGATGKLLSNWGSNLFVMPHGLTVDSKDHIWLTDVALQQVFKYTSDGKLLMTLGERGKPGNDQHHFNLPTDVAVLPDGSFYVSDGYRNTRVIKFTADGRYEFEWGVKGSGPGQFNLPHGLALDDQGHVYVCDRSNSRLQVFDRQGQFLADWHGPSIGRPYGVAVDNQQHIFLIDGGEPKLPRSMRGKAVELDAKGQVLDRFGGYGKSPGEFQLGHDIAVGPDGAVYVAEGNGQRVQKFIPQPR